MFIDGIIKQEKVKNLKCPKQSKSLWINVKFIFLISDYPIVQKYFKTLWIPFVI